MKPRRPIPPKRPFVTAEHHEQFIYFKGVIGRPRDTLYAGHAVVSVSQVGKKKALVVHVLEQGTKRIKTGLARQLEGWKNSAMERIEEIAKRQGCSLILFNSAYNHSESNNTDYPIHVELLETYGRLPMQHGYRLKHLPDAPVIGMNRRRLWWVKKL